LAKGSNIQSAREEEKHTEYGAVETLGNLVETETAKSKGISALFLHKKTSSSLANKVVIGSN